ncbi:MAG: YDG domain-containing protein [Gemmatimonadales bacterium]
MFRTASARLASIVSAAVLTLAPSLLHAQKALVYCPVGIDAAGCNAIVAAIAADAARFPGGADAGYDGTQGTVDLAAVDLSGYTVLVVPSLADGAGVQPYALLRNATIAGRLKAAFMGRTAAWSGTPDVGSTNRAAKDELIRNLAAWAREDSAKTHGPGVVALEDNSDDAAARYNWLGAISAMSLTADTTLDVYSNVQVLTATGRTILTNSAGVQIGYTNMASFGLVRAADGSGSTDDATGARTARVVLVTAAGDPSDPNIATVTTDRDDYVPGDTVTITGAGWDPAETVRLTIHEEVTPSIHPDDVLSTVADGAGHILNHEFPIDSADLGIRFTLTATGLTSGKTAQATFTDLPRIAAAVTVGAQSGAPTYGTAGSATFTVTPTRAANGTVNGTFSVTSGLPAGVTAAFAPATFTANGGTAFPSSTMTLTTTAAALPGTYSLNVRVTDGSDQGNGTATFTIAPKTITGSITASNKVYDATTAATILTRTLTGVIAGDVVTLTGGTATFANKNVGTGKTVTATGLSLTGAQASRYVLASTTATTTANITAFTITATFTAANKVYDGTTSATILTRTPVGVFAGDVVTLTGGTAAFATKTVGTGKTVTATGFVLGGADAGNYLLGTIASTTADITGQPLTLSFTAADKVYDGTTAATIVTRSIASGLQSGDVVTVNGGTATFANKNVGTGKTVTATGFTLGGADAANYTIGTVNTTTANITVASVTPAVTIQNKTYDGTTAATILTRTLTGAIAGDAVSLTGGTAVFADKNVGTGKTVSVTGLSLTGADAPNYVLTSTSATATADITARAITVTAASDTKGYDGTTSSAGTPTVTVGTLAPGDVGSFTQTYDTKNAGTGKTLTPAGTVTDGNSGNNYAITFAPNTTGVITVKPVTPVVVADDKVYDGTTAATLASQTVTGTIPPDVVTLVVGSATFADKSVGTNKTVTASGLSLGGADAANYALSSATATDQANITPRTLTVTATGVDKVYDGTAAASVTLADDRISGDVLTASYASATFADKNVGNAKPISVTGISIAGADAGNYALASTTASATANITAATVTGSVTVSDKVYDGTTAATIATRSLTGVIGSDDVSLSGGTATFADKHVGTAKTVTVTGLTLAGGDAGNYVLSSTSATTTASITAASVTPHVTANNKVYDGTTTATIATATLTGAIAGDDVSLTVGSATFDTRNVGTGKTVTATGLTLAGADAGNYVLTATSATTTADITALALVGSITANDKVYDGTTAATILTRTLAGVIAPDVVTYIGGTATFADKDAGTGKTVTATGLSLSGADAGNYTVNATATTTASITKRALVVSATGQNRIYDGTTDAAVTLSDDRVAGDALTLGYAAAAFADKNVGTGKTVTVSGISVTGADAGNYTWNTTATTTADITARTLTVTASGQNRVYDATTNATVTLSDDRVAGDLLTLSYASASFADKHAGTAKPISVTGINVTSADAGNYTWNTTASATADITPRALVVTATGQNRIYDGTTAATVTLADDRIAGDVFTANYASAAFVDKHVGTAKPVTVTGISLSGADAGDYTPNTTASTTADITPRALVVTATGQNKVYDGTTAATVTLSDDRVAGDVLTLAYASAAFADKHAGTAKTVSVTGISVTGADAGNYNWNTTATATADITPRALVITATGQNKVYDGTTAATVTLADDRIAGDVFTASYSSATFADKHVGTGKPISVTGISISGPDAGNYSANTTASATADITARSLTVTATGVNKVYDGTTTATVTLSDDRVAGDGFTATYASATFADRHVGTAKPIAVAGVAISGADAGNYQLTSTTASATADITPRTLAVTASATNKVYDGTTAATVTLADDRLAGDLFSVTFGSATFADKNVGAGKLVTVSGIALSGPDAANYSANTTATATADITARTLTVTATAQNKVYDGTTAATVSLSDDRVGGDVFSVTYASATFANKNVGSAKTVTVSGLALTGTDAGNYDLSSTTATASADITTRTLTVTAAGQNRVYDATTSATVTLSDDRVAGDVLTLAYASASFADKHAGTAKTVSVSGISVTGADAGNYTWNTTASTTADITARALVVTATGVNRVYDGTTAATVTLADDRIAGDVFTASYASASFADKNVGATKPVSVTGLSLSGADAGDYTPNTTASATADITTRALVVAATGISKVYDGTAAATVTLSDDRVAGDALSTSYAAAAFGNKNVGTGKTISVTGISVAGADAGNYSWNTTATATADITARTLAVTATGVNKVYDATTSATVTLADDRLAGDVFTASYSSASFANKNVGTGKPVSVTGIAISGLDAGNYAANTSTSTTADITTATLAVTATGVNKVYDGGMAATVNLVFTPLLSDNVTASYTSATFGDKNVGTGKTVTVTGIALGGTDAPNYTANTTTTTTADITAFGLTGTITASNKVYDGTTAATIATRSLTGVIGTDVVSYTGGTATFANKTVGAGKAVTATGLALSGADAGNYSVNTSATATADITALGITGNITAASKVYDATTAATILTRTLTGAIAGDAVSYAGGTGAFNTKDVANAKPVNATGLSLSGADAANYTVNTAAATTANITAASSTTVVTSSPASLPYSDNPQSLPLAATVTSPTVPGVSEGSVVFTIKNASNVVVGSATAPVSVFGGAASATYSMPATTDVGTYTITAAFTGANFGVGSSGNGTLTVQPANFETTTATTDADFNNADDLDVLFKNDGKLSTLKLQNTNPGTVHYQLTYKNVTGVDINASNGATLKTIIEIPPVSSCGAVTCSSAVDKTAPAWSLKGAKAVHVAPDDKTDDMAVQFSYKASGSCADESTGYVSTLTGIAANAPKCIRVTGFAIPKKHRARIDLHLEFRWKDSGGWAPSPDPKLYFYSGFAFKSTSTGYFPSVAPSVRTSFESAGLVAAGQKVTAAGGFVFDVGSNPVANYRVRLFNTSADASAPNACALVNANVVSETTTMLDGFWFVWKKGNNQANLAAPDLPSKVQYSMVVCDNAPTPAVVASRTMSAKMPDKDFDQEDFRLTTLVASGP